MNALVNYFEHIPSLHRSIIFFSGLVVFFLIEGFVPLKSMNYKRGQHSWLNIFFMATSIVINLLLAFLFLKTSDWVSANHIGLVPLLHIQNLLLSTLVGLMLMDLVGAWLVHFTEHKIKWMWRFHLIHHTDMHVDATTANRHHPGESIFRFAFTLLAVIITGAPWWLIMLYQSLSVLLSQFNHANLNLPERLDKAMSWFIVSPNMHKVHHHYVLPYTDSNYGNIFSVWDRMFGTFHYLAPEKIVYGIDTHMSEHEHNRIGNLLKIPFQDYRAPTVSKFRNSNSVERLA